MQLKIGKLQYFETSRKLEIRGRSELRDQSIVFTALRVIGEAFSTRLRQRNGRTERSHSQRQTNDTSEDHQWQLLER